MKYYHIKNNPKMTGSHLLKVMKSERAGHQFKGYVIRRCDENDRAFKNASKRLESACGELVEHARYWGRGIQLFKTPAGQIGAMLD